MDSGYLEHKSSTTAWQQRKLKGFREFQRVYFFTILPATINNCNCNLSDFSQVSKLTKTWNLLFAKVIGPNFRLKFNFQTRRDEGAIISLNVTLYKPIFCKYANNMLIVFIEIHTQRLKILFFFVFFSLRSRSVEH